MTQPRASCRLAALLMAVGLAGCGGSPPVDPPKAAEEQANARQNNAKANPGPGGMPPKAARTR